MFTAGGGAAMLECKAIAAVPALSTPLGGCWSAVASFDERDAAVRAKTKPECEKLVGTAVSTGSMMCCSRCRLGEAP